MEAHVSINDKIADFINSEYNWPVVESIIMEGLIDHHANPQRKVRITAKLNIIMDDKMFNSKEGQEGVASSIESAVQHFMQYGSASSSVPYEIRIVGR